MWQCHRRTFEDGGTHLSENDLEVFGLSAGKLPPGLASHQGDVIALWVPQTGKLRSMAPQQVP